MQCKDNYKRIVGQPLLFTKITPYCWHNVKGTCTTTNAYLIVYQSDDYSLFHLPTYDLKKGPHFWKDYPTLHHLSETFEYTCKELTHLYKGLRDFWVEAIKTLGPIMAQDKAERAARMSGKNGGDISKPDSSSSSSSQLNPPKF